MLTQDNHHLAAPPPPPPLLPPPPGHTTNHTPPDHCSTASRLYPAGGRQFAGINVRVPGHPSPVLRVKVVEDAPFRRPVLLEDRMRHPRDPDLLLYVIPPVPVLPEREMRGISPGATHTRPRVPTIPRPRAPASHRRRSCRRGRRAGRPCTSSAGTATASPVSTC